MWPRGRASLLYKVHKWSRSLTFAAKIGLDLCWGLWAVNILDELGICYTNYNDVQFYMHVTYCFRNSCTECVSQGARGRFWLWIMNRYQDHLSIQNIQLSSGTHDAQIISLKGYMTLFHLLHRWAAMSVSNNS